MRPGQAFRQLLRSRSGLARRSLASSALALGTLLVLGCVPGAERREASAPPRWTSRAIPEAKGEIKEVDGQRVQIRYKDEVFSAITTNFERWPTYSYNDTRKFPPPNRTPMPAVKGDPRRGRELFMSRQKAPCTGCHLIPGDDVWPAGSVGPDLSVIGDRRLPDQYLFQFIWDARVVLPDPSMPPWGTSGILSPEETRHIVAFLQTLKGNPPFVPPAEKYPRYFSAYGRVMSIEDFLTVHAPEKTGNEMLAQSPAHLAMAILIKMQSNGMPVSIDVTSPEARAAYERGRALYHQRVGRRNHACADCHDADRGAGRFAGGRVLSLAQNGMTKHFPVWF